MKTGKEFIEKLNTISSIQDSWMTSSIRKKVAILEDIKKSEIPWCLFIRKIEENASDLKKDTIRRIIAIPELHESILQNCIPKRIAFIQENDKIVFIQPNASSGKAFAFAFKLPTTRENIVGIMSCIDVVFVFYSDLSIIIVQPDLQFIYKQENTIFNARSLKIHEVFVSSVDSTALAFQNSETGERYYFRIICDPWLDGVRIFPSIVADGDSYVKIENKLCDLFSLGKRNYKLTENSILEYVTDVKAEEYYLDWKQNDIPSSIHPQTNLVLLK